LINWYTKHNMDEGTRRLEIVTAAGICLVWNIINGNEIDHKIHLKCISNALHISSFTIQKIYVNMKHYYIEIIRQLPWGNDMEAKAFFVYANELIIWLPALTENSIKNIPASSKNFEKEEKIRKMNIAL